MRIKCVRASWLGAVVLALACFSAGSGAHAGRAAAAAPNPVSYGLGWNLVAGPTGSTLVGAVGDMYTFTTGNSDSEYLPVPSDQPLSGCNGYWAYFPNGGSISFNLDKSTGVCRRPVQSFQWVLVGNPSATEPVTVTGVNILLTWDPLTGYANASALPDKLAPGQGAFVQPYSLSGNGGRIDLLDAAAGSATSQSSLITSFSGQGPQDNHFNTPTDKLQVCWVLSGGNPPQSRPVITIKIFPPRSASFSGPIGNTNPNACLTFTGLGPGDYTVQVDAPADTSYIISICSQGSGSCGGSLGTSGSAGGTPGAFSGGAGGTPSASSGGAGGTPGPSGGGGCGSRGGPGGARLPNGNCP